jgi:class 3 adenylate cyclase/tetratricopeptide (TPR) repeat protein
MRCASCGAELLSGAKFCHACGARAALACGGCGASISPEFRFCPECGREVVPAAPAGGTLDRLSRSIPSDLAHKIRAAQGHIEGERKQVTVLFCDLAGSTAIAEQLDPEEYHDLLEKYLELAFAEVYRYEGIVTVLAGDGLMALFGAPVAHEDAPQYAVLAALAIQEAVGRLRPTVLADRGQVLQARIGIHTGPVVVGTVGNDLKMDYTAIGDTTNLAARLEALAPPGSVLVSEATYRLVRGRFRVRPAGPLEVRGKRDPVAAYEVLGASEATMPMAIAAERGLTPYVGRSAELSQLEAAFRRLQGGAAEVVTVVGGAGSGKSRLIYEWKHHIADQPGLVLEGRCSALGHAVPYLPFVTMFRAYFDLVPGETRESAIAKLCARVADWREKPGLTERLVTRLLGLPMSPDDEGEEHRREAFDAVGDLLLAESRRAPVVLIVEDVHVIDDGSRDLLQALVAKLANAPVLLVVSRRPDDRRGWRAQAAFTQIVLRRLPDDDVRAMIRAVAGGVLPGELEDVLVARAEGSPFFAEEITRALVEEGYLVRENGRRRLTRPIEELRIPGTVQEVIAARLDRLGAHEKRVVQVASVLGRQFSARELTGLLDGEGIEVPRALAELERRGLFHRKHFLGGDDYRFGESLTQEVAYESLLHRQRRQLHERVGQLLEASPSESTPARTALLAHHYARSDNRSKAIAALLSAAADAERLPSYRAAADFFRQAWDLAEAQAQDGADPAAQRLVLEASAGFCRVTVLFGLPHVAEAERAAERGRALAEALGDRDALSVLTYFQGAIVIGRGRDHFARGLELSEQALATAEQAGLRTTAMRLSRGLCIHYVLDGRFDLARRTIDWVVDELEQSEVHEQPFADIYVSARWVRDVVRYLSDDLDEVLAATTETHALAVRIPNRTIRSGAAGTLAQVHYLRGDYEAAKRWADEGLEIAEAIGNLSAFPAAAAIALAARVELGEPVAPGRYLERIDQGLVTAAGSQLNVRFVGDALVAVGDRSRLERYAETLRVHPGGRLREALVGTALGDVLAALGRPDEAECRYRDALAFAESVGARSALAGAAYGIARLAAERGDEATALRYRDRALAVAQALGLTRYTRRLERLGMPAAAASA